MGERARQSVTIRIPAGTRHGSTVRVRGKVPATGTGINPPEPGTG